MMFNRNTAAMTTLVLAVVLAVGSGCFGRKVTIDAINSAKRDLTSSLAKVQNKADDTTEVVDSAYDKLKGYLEEKNLSDRNLKKLEGRLEKMQERHDELTSAINRSQSEADDLFGMLKRRARENKTRSLRKQLLQQVSAKENAFDEKTAAAEKLMVKIRSSIQKYDDIVGFFQVNKGLEGVDEIMEDIDSAILEGQELNSEIRQYVDEGLSIIEAL